VSPRAGLGLSLAMCALTGCAGGRGLSALDEQPALGEPRGFSPPAPLERRLSTGLTVWLLQRPDLPLSTALLLVPAGAAADPADRPGLAALCADMLDESTQARGALELSSALERLGAELALGAGRDYAWAQLGVLSRHLDPALALLGEALASPRFAPEDVERVRGIRLSDLSQAMEDAPRLATRLLGPLAYGAAHPYGRPDDGSPAGLRAITRDELVAFHRARWRPDQAVLVLAGDLDEATSLALLESRLGAWRAPPGQALAPAAPAPLPASSARVWVVDLPGASQTRIALGVPGLRRADPALPLLALADSALGGTFTSRLNQNLREDKGYTYGAFSSLDPGAGQGLWLVHTSVDGEATGGRCGSCWPSSGGSRRAASAPRSSARPRPPSARRRSRRSPPRPRPWASSPTRPSTASAPAPSACGWRRRPGPRPRS